MTSVLSLRRGGAWSTVLEESLDSSTKKHPAYGYCSVWHDAARTTCHTTTQRVKRLNRRVDWQGSTCELDILDHAVVTSLPVGSLSLVSLFHGVAHLSLAAPFIDYTVLGGFLIHKATGETTS